jgi:hypothetical protein
MHALNLRRVRGCPRQGYHTWQQRVVVLLAKQESVNKETQCRKSLKIKLSIPRFSAPLSYGRFCCGGEHGRHAGTQVFPPHMEG